MDQTALVDTIVKTPEYITAAIAAVGAIIGAVLATSVALLSVRMQNRHSRQQLQQQLEFESRERQRERLLALRRDIYLPAAEAFSTALSALTRMLTRDAVDDEFDNRLRELGRAVARVETIATGETLAAASEVQRAMLDAFMSATKRRMPMMMRASAIALAHSDVSKADADRSKCIDMMKEVLLSGDKDDRRVKAIRDVDSIARRKWRAAMTKLLRLTLQQETDRLTLTRELVDHMGHWGGAQLRLATAIRRELEASDEAAVMAQLGQESTARGIELIREFVPLLEGVVDEGRRTLETFEAESDAEKKAPAASTGAESATARVGSSTQAADTPAV